MKVGWRVHDCEGFITMGEVWTATSYTQRLAPRDLVWGEVYTCEGYNYTYSTMGRWGGVCTKKLPPRELVHIGTCHENGLL